MEEHHHHEMPENMQNLHRGHNHSTGKEAYENVDSSACHSHGGGAHGDHGGGHMMHMGDLKQRFWISLIVAIPIILLSPMMGLNLPFQFSFPGSDWVVLVLASFLFFYGGKPFFSSAGMELKDRDPAMMTLISMGIAVAYVYSLYAFISNHLFHDAGHKMDFFWELATLIVIMLLGHWIEMKAVGNAGNALQKMAELLPGSAHLLNADGSVVDVPLQEIRIGEHVIVKSGEKMPADGKVISGETTVNESMVTGEAKSAGKHVGDRVIGGSVNGNGTITIEVTGTGESGYLAQVMKLVEGAQQEKSKSETISDKVAKALFYVAVVAGILAFIVWLIVTKDVNIALERLVTVLVIACPHALGLAIPLVVARSISMGAQHGLLIRNRNALEKAKKVSVVAMDKTGTLTEGDFHVSGIGSLSGKWSEDDVLRMMASLESKSNHPLGVGILNEAKKKNLSFPKSENVQVINGMGLSGTIDQEEVKIVSASWLEKNKLAYDKEHFRILSGHGNSVSYLVVDNIVAGYVAQGDQVKAQAEAAVSELNRLQIQPVMLTGDNEGFARSVGHAVGISEVHAGLLPEDKEKIIAGYKHKGEVVMMVGDGVNDAPALARADIGVAIGAGTDVAIDSADVVLVKSNPFDIIHFLSLAKNTARKMVQNLWWGAGYNIIAIPLAAGVLAPVGIILSPAVGAILMSCSTIIVAINAMALKMK